MNTFTSLFILLITMGLLAACEPAETTLIDEDAELVLISSGHQFTEGPYWHPDGYLLFSDIPADRVYRWVPGEESEVYLDPAGLPNGIQADTNGDVLIAQHTGRLSRLVNGEFEVLADTYEGSSLNSPNDLAVHSSGIIYFTDPPYGVELHDVDRDQELDFGGVYRLTPDGELTVIYNEFTHPNGIVFSPDESLMYVNNSATGDITVFDVDSDGITSNARHFASVGQRPGAGVADGMVVDTEGRLYSTGPDGISIFTAEGEHIQNVDIFEASATNIEWKGDELNVLFVTSVSNVFMLDFNVTGHKPR